MDTCKTLKPFTPKSDHSVHSTIMFMKCDEKKKNFSSKRKVLLEVTPNLES